MTCLEVSGFSQALGLSHGCLVLILAPVQHSSVGRLQGTLYLWFREGLAPADSLLMPIRPADKGMDVLFPNTSVLGNKVTSL